MDILTVLGLVKARLGINSSIRDTYLKAIIDGIIKELEDEKELKLNKDNSYHLMFVVDYVTWRYQSVQSTETSFTGVPISMPRHLQYRLHNLLIHAGGDK